MQVGRAITTILVAVSLAFAPALGGIAPAGAAVAKSAQHARAADHGMPHGPSHHHGAGSPDLASTPCCPDEGAPVKRALDDCAAMAGCMLCYCQLMTGAVAALATPLTLLAALSWSVSHAIPPPATAGPFRPPRS